MYYHADTDQYINPDHAFVLGDVQYPFNWLSLASDDEIGALGLVPVITVGTPADEMFYEVSESRSNGVITIINTPRDAGTVRGVLLAQLMQQCDARLATLTTGYPSGERDSWGKQEAEARAALAVVISSGGAPVATAPAAQRAAAPLLSAIADARGIDLMVLAGRVVAKANEFAAAAGAIIGRRQALEQAIHDAADVAALQAIDLNTGWPA